MAELFLARSHSYPTYRGKRQRRTSPVTTAVSKLRGLGETRVGGIREKLSSYRLSFKRGQAS